MNQQPPQHNTSALDMFGKACGLIVAVLFTMPLNALTYHFFADYVLRYVNVQDDTLLSWGWLACLFFLIFSSTWCALTLLISLIQKALIFIAIRLNANGGW